MFRPGIVIGGGIGTKQAGETACVEALYSERAVELSLFGLQSLDSSVVGLDLLENIVVVL